MLTRPAALRLELVESFVALADALHFTRAAAALQLTPSGLSRRIDCLERSLDVRLFDRTTRRVQLTPSGEVLLPHARSMLASADEVRRATLALAELEPADERVAPGLTAAMT